MKRYIFAVLISLLIIISVFLIFNRKTNTVYKILDFTIYPASSQSADGKWVTINGNHVLMKD